MSLKLKKRKSFAICLYELSTSSSILNTVASDLRRIFVLVCQVVETVIL